MTQTAKVLLIESDPDFAALAHAFLTNGGGSYWEFGLDCAERLETGLRSLKAEPYDVVLLDLDLPECRGLEALQRVFTAKPHVPVVALVSLGQEPLGLEAISRGGQEYLVKGTLDARLLKRTLRYAVEKAGLLARLDLLSRQIRQLSI